MESSRVLKGNFYLPQEYKKLETEISKKKVKTTRKWIPDYKENYSYAPNARIENPRFDRYSFYISLKNYNNINFPS